MSARVRSPGWVGEVEQLAEDHYKQLKPRVLAAVARRLSGHQPRIEVDRLDLEGAYNGAWHAICRHKAKGGTIRTLDGLLIAATYRLALNVPRAGKDSRRVAADLDARPDASFDLAKAAEDRLLLQELFSRLAYRLNAKERRGVVLCLLYGYSRAEAAGALGIREPAFQKMMDRAMRKVDAVVAGIRARGCGEAEWAEEVRSIALGSLSQDGPGYQRVREHLDACRDCRRYAAGLEGLALLPPIGAPLLRFLHHTSVLARIGGLFGNRSGGLSGAASQGGVTSRAGSGGMASLLGGGAAAKTAAVIVVAAGMAAATVPALSSHASAHHPPHDGGPHSALVTQSTPPSPPQAGVAHAQRLPKRAGHPQPRAHSLKTPKAATSRSPRRPAGSQSAQDEFGFERRPATATPVSASPRPSQSAQPAGSERQLEAAEAEFGIEH